MMSQAQAYGIEATRIISFNVSDTEPAVGESVQVTGILQYQTPLFGFWNPAGGYAIQVYANDQMVGETQTLPDGSFSVQWTPQGVGQYVVKAVFPGAGLLNGSSSNTILVTAITQQEKQQQQQQQQQNMLIAIVAGVVAVAAVGGIIAYIVNQQAFTEMVLAASRR